MRQPVSQQSVNRKDLLHVLEASMCTKGQSRNSEPLRGPGKVNALALCMPHESRSFFFSRFYMYSRQSVNELLNSCVIPLLVPLVLLVIEYN